MFSQQRGQHLTLTRKFEGKPSRLQRKATVKLQKDKFQWQTSPDKLLIEE